MGLLPFWAKFPDANLHKTGAGPIRQDFGKYYPILPVNRQRRKLAKHSATASTTSTQFHDGNAFFARSSSVALSLLSSIFNFYSVSLLTVSVYGIGLSKSQKSHIISPVQWEMHYFNGSSLISASANAIFSIPFKFANARVGQSH
jgi:hypothetical protein